MKKLRIILVLIAIASLITGIAVFLLTGGLQHDVSPLVALGEKYLEEGDYEEAALQFEKAISIAKKTPEAWYGAARADIGLGNEDEAIEALKTVAELDPSQEDKISWMIEKIEAGEGEDLIPLPYDVDVTSDEEYLSFLGPEEADESSDTEIVEDTTEEALPGNIVFALPEITSVEEGTYYKAWDKYRGELEAAGYGQGDVGSALVQWNEVEGAEGYEITFYWMSDAQDESPNILTYDVEKVGDKYLIPDGAFADEYQCASGDWPSPNYSTIPQMGCYSGGSIYYLSKVTIRAYRGVDGYLAYSEEAVYNL